MYFNHGATSKPKPDCVYEAVDQCLRGMDSPGRARTRKGRGDTDVLEESRAAVAGFLGIGDPSRLAFTPGCTYALNLAILGLPWERGDTAFMSGLEHHAVSRPMRKAARELGVELVISPYQTGSPVDLDFLEGVLRRGGVRLVACMSASNVTGELLPVEEIVELAHAHGALALIDVSQTAGVLPVDAAELGADLLAFPGHKALMGPPGVGGLYVRPGLDLKPLLEGGTGNDSGKHELGTAVPAIYEVGTHNLPAIAGLAAGIGWVKAVGREAIAAKKKALTKRLLDGLAAIPAVRVYGTADLSRRTAVVSITMDGWSPIGLAEWLATAYGVVSRAGFHCAPLAHESIGTLSGGGTVRFSPGYDNTEAEVDSLIGYLQEAHRRGKP